jgi:hypothetical protein
VDDFVMGFSQEQHRLLISGLIAPVQPKLPYIIPESLLFLPDFFVRRIRFFKETSNTLETVDFIR